jgi:hypothetical protein
MGAKIGVCRVERGRQRGVVAPGLGEEQTALD